MDAARLLRPAREASRRDGRRGRLARAERAPRPDFRRGGARLTLRDDAANGATSNAGPSALRTRFDSFRSAQRRGPLGLPEVLALTAAAALLLLAVFAYLFLLVPQRSRLQSLEVERGDLQRVIQSTEHVVGGQKDTQQRGREILARLKCLLCESLGKA